MDCPVLDFLVSCQVISKLSMEWILICYFIYHNLLQLCINFVLLACNYNITKEALKYIIISISAPLRINFIDEGIKKRWRMLNISVFFE